MTLRSNIALFMGDLVPRQYCRQKVVMSLKYELAEILLILCE